MKNLGKLVALLVLSAAAGIAAADGDSGDSSMNPYTGDSWAALQGGGHNLGEVGRVTVRISKADGQKAPASASGAAPASTRLARSGRGSRTVPFRDDTSS